MSSLDALFSKAKAASGENKTPPAPPPSTATPTAFKIGGTPAPTPAPNEEPAKPAPFAGFKMGGAVSATASSQQEAPTNEQASAPAVQKESPAPTSNPMTELPEDHTPATLPQRTIPADVGEAVQRFIANLDHLHKLAPEPELASAAIRNIMIELKSNPQYMDHVLDDDIRVIVQLMRETMGLARIEKEKKASTRSKKNKESVAAAVADLAFLDEMLG